MTDQIEEKEFPEILIEEESELVKELRADIKFLREIVLTLSNNNKQPTRPLVNAVPVNAEPEDIIIEDYTQSRTLLENHFQKQAEELEKKRKENEGKATLKS